MKRLLSTFVLFLALAVPTFAGEPSGNLLKSFLGSREVVATVVFSAGSAGLNAQGKKEIDRIAPRLQEIDPQRTLVRIEGFASSDGNKWVNVPISMSRAKAVLDYLRERYQLKTLDLSLTGFGSGEGEGHLRIDPGCRADIALYDNAWAMSGGTVEKVGPR